jgi:hypothetical protein
MAGTSEHSFADSLRRMERTLFFQRRTRMYLSSDVDETSWAVCRELLQLRTHIARHGIH